MNFFEALVDNVYGGVYVIAEGCDNHMGSTIVAKALVDAAVASGADAIKFQHHLVEEEMLVNDLSSDNFDEPLHEFLKVNALNLNQHHELKSYCDTKSITYLCTPFSYKAAIEIEHLVPFFKIGSGEFQDYWYIDKLAELKKPIIFSTGMCDEVEIKSWLKRYSDIIEDFALLNCISEYPPKYEDLNIRFLDKLDKMSSCVIGHSDHSPTIGSSVSAVSFGARIIEKHITLSHFIAGPDASVSLDPGEFKAMVDAVKLVRTTLGNSKTIQDKERPIRGWAYRSLITTRPIKAGQVITLDDICTKRPGDGILSADYESVLGKVAVKNIRKNIPFSLEDLSE
ncbi:N-acetylneuraminate synthase family protein [Haliea sp. AH-315-K21]|uniref:CMP-N-acetylneuraminic acid synthetase n=1 Tax=SAR86 cluster bacterium TaxID=2030880 RepID=A0A2A5CAB3_9GAMM|nr:N-acetylneuraminate synthase family protein [Haliea sp. AH-315-K21]MBN4075937.1 N-acetylneuraminate synthase family protein [Gammaproteobacteria bacterium AH-315-E17]PCJ40431.1 MAG: CMP-N-acetylneuraminic acid synthetase [SAR86 cluster bacterium]